MSQMSKALIGLMSTALVFSAAITGTARAEEAGGNAAVLNQLLNTPAANAWSAWGAKAALKKDSTVTGGAAMRIEIAAKPANPWEAAAAIPISKPVSKGDVVLVSFWARAVTPAPGGTTATLSSIAVQQSKAPYTSLFNEAAEVTGTWAMYYASGVAGEDYGAGQLNVSVQLGAAQQTVDLGPAFVLNLGPHYDVSKLPHNKKAAPAPAAAPAAAVATPAMRIDAALTSLRAKLPRAGTLISDPTHLAFAYGTDQTSQNIAASDVPGGAAIRTILSKAGANPWDDGISFPLNGAVKQGDTIVMAAYLRSNDGAGTISTMGIALNHAPWSQIIAKPVTVPAGGWHLITVSDSATATASASELMAMMQTGAAKQSLDVGPIFVLNLGAGVTPPQLP